MWDTIPRRTIAHKRYCVFRSKLCADLLYGNTEKCSAKAQETELVSVVVPSGIEVSQNSEIGWAGSIHLCDFHLDRYNELHRHLDKNPTLSLAVLMFIRYKDKRESVGSQDSGLGLTADKSCWVWGAAQIQAEVSGQLVLSFSRGVNRGTHGLVSALQAVCINALLCCWIWLLVWPGRQGSRDTATLRSSVLTLCLWCLETSDQPRREQEKAFTWTDSGNRQLRGVWSRAEASAHNPKFTWQNLMFLSFLLLMFIHIPAVGGHPQQKHSFSLYWQGKSQRLTYSGERKQKVGEVARTEWCTDSVHPLWRSCKGNPFPYSLWSLLRDMVSSEGSKVHLWAVELS